MQNYNWVQENVSTTGTGAAMTLSGAVAGFCTFATRYPTGTIVAYEIVDGNNRESGVGVMTNSTTLTKSTIWEKLESGVLSEMPATGLSLSGTAKIMVAASTETTSSVGIRGENLSATNRWLVDAFMAPTKATGAVGLTSITMCPLYVTAPAIISGLALNVTVLGAASIMRLGLYKADGKYLRQLRTTADIDVSVATGVTGVKAVAFTGGNIALRPGMYFAAISGSGATITTTNVGNSLRHPFVLPSSDDLPSHYSYASGGIPLAASYGPIDGNWASGNPQNHPHIVGILV